MTRETVFAVYSVISSKQFAGEKLFHFLGTEPSEKSVTEHNSFWLADYWNRILLQFCNLPASDDEVAAQAA